MPVAMWAGSIYAPWNIPAESQHNSYFLCSQSVIFNLLYRPPRDMTEPSSQKTCQSSTATPPSTTLYNSCIPQGWRAIKRGVSILRNNPCLTKINWTVLEQLEFPLSVKDQLQEENEPVYVKDWLHWITLATILAGMLQCLLEETEPRLTGFCLYFSDSASRRNGGRMVLPKQLFSPSQCAMEPL